MAAGTKIRTLSRLLDASSFPLWVIGGDGKIVYLSAGVGEWLGIDVQTLAGRRSVAGSSISDDPLDFVAASLSPPPGFHDQGTASLRVQPPPIDGRKIKALDVRFVRLGANRSEASSKDCLTIAVSGEFADTHTSIEIQDAIALRKQLDGWRKRHANITTICTAGGSASARRLRARLHVAASTRTHIGVFGPRGCGAFSIGSRIHQLSAPGEPIACVDGPLMDPELLDATLMPVVNRLAESKSATASVLIRELDDTPSEAQQRLSELLNTFSDRLRLIGLCSSRPTLLKEPLAADTDDKAIDPLAETPETVGLCPAMVDALNRFCLTVDPLSQRVDDIPILATAALDARHAAGEGPAERFSRAALDALVIYPWPGNFDELDEAIRHAIGTTPHESVGVEHLPLAIRSYRPDENPVSPKIANLTLDESVSRYEMKIIHDVVEAAGGNRAEAARRLGISRARLLRKLDGK